MSYRQEFPDCCGADIISDLHVDENGKLRVDTGLHDTSGDGSKIGMLVAITSTENSPDVIKALKKDGFDPVKKGRNPRTGNMMTVWVKTSERKRLIRRLARRTG